MKTRRHNKKGFTIVELVIVIAVIAILAGVLIPTFASVIKKANQSKDIQLVRNLNTALAVDETQNKTMHDALAAAADFGYDVTKINASATNSEILWDSVNDMFCYFSDNEIQYVPESALATPAENIAEYQYWVISNEIHERYSTYYTGTETEISTTKGFDAGVNTAITKISYTRAADATAQSVVIRTNGGTLSVSAPTDTVKHFGDSEAVYIGAVADASFHEFGKTQFTQITKGRYVLESSGSTNAIVISNSNPDNVKLVGADSVHKYEAADAIVVEKIKAGAVDFAGGTGTEADPYLIENAAHMQNITKYYDKGYNYFKVKDGVTAIDCSGWYSVNLNGSFDGNGVLFNNVTARLFKNVGYQNTEVEITLKNFDANMNLVASSAACVGNIYNSGTTIFENVNVHGYIEGNYNSAAYYNYGTTNYDGIGADYTVKFVNCKSDATLVCPSGNSMAGFVGHAYEGTGHTFSLYVDANCEYTGTIYTTTGVGFKYVCVNTNDAAMTLNGESFSRLSEENKYSNTKTITVVNPEKGETAYTVAKQANVAKITVSTTAQTTVTDKDGNKIANQSGITMTVSTTDITDLTGDVINVFETGFTSAEIVNGTNELKVVVENGVLKLYTRSTDNITQGTIRLQVTQYDVNGNLIACGTVTLATVN